jgi:autotransporter-associated beta strand protein
MGPLDPAGHVVDANPISNSSNHSIPMKITSPPTFAKALGVFTVIAVLGLLPRAEAATLYWDTNGATAGTNATASGTWDAGTTSLWTTVLAGDVATGTWTNGNEASFSAGTNGTGLQTVTVNGTVSASGIVVKDGSLTLNGASSPSLTIGSGGINVTSSVSAKTTLGSTLGRVNLSDNQTWTAGGGASAGFAINSGITTSAASGTVTLTIAGGGSGTATTSSAGGTLIDGANAKLAFTYNNSGQLTMAGANTYSGGTTLSGTTVGGTSSAVLIVNTVSVGSSGNVTSGVFGTGTITLNGGSVKMRATTGGSMTLYNNVTLSGDLQFVTASLSDKSLTLAGPITISGSSRTINTDASQAPATVPALGIISGNIGDGGNTLGLTKSGAGLLILTGNNTYTGDTRIGNGTLAIGAASGTGTLALQNTTVDLNAADLGTIQFGTSNATTTTSATFGGLKGTRNLALTNANATPAAVALTVGGNNGNTTYSGNLTGTGGSLTKSGSGTLTLSGTNTYTGTTAVSTGTLLINGSTSSSSIVTVASTGTLGGTGSVGGATTISGTHNPGISPGIQTFSSDLTYSGGSSVVNWELKSSTTTNAANPSAIFDTIVVNGNLDFAGATTLNLSFVPTGSNVLWSDSFWSTSKTGTSGWLLYDLSGANTVSNFTNLSLASSNWLDSGSFAFNTARPGASFTVVQSGNDIYLNYTAVPEPATWVLAFSGLAFVLVARRLRHRC